MSANEGDKNGEKNEIGKMRWEWKNLDGKYLVRMRRKKMDGKHGMSGFNMNVRMKKTWMEKSRMSDL